jgi:hypothetical protein
MERTIKQRKNTQERWRELCAKAAAEQDGQKLSELVQEINHLEKKERRLGVLPPKK